MKIIKIIFITLFLLIILIPLIFIDTKSNISLMENRTLATFPRIYNIRDIINTPKAIDNYIDDRFGFKNKFLSLANKLITPSNTINGNVVIGKNDWLFYSNENDGNNITDFFKKNLLDNGEIERIVNYINDINNWCNNNDIYFILLIAPNKHNIYPEFYPYKRPKGITRTEQIMNIIPDSLMNNIIYPVDELLNKKTKDLPLYYETDTHWNMAGAYVAYEIIKNNIKNIFSELNFPDISYITDISFDFSGDIVLMSGFDSYGKRTIPNIYPVNGWRYYYEYEKNEEHNGIVTRNNDISLPTAIVFRDSFFVQLEPFISTLFSTVEYNWRQLSENDKQYIIENRPNVIIFEIVERHISNMLWMNNF